MQWKYVKKTLIFTEISLKTASRERGKAGKVPIWVCKLPAVGYGYVRKGFWWKSQFDSIVGTFWSIKNAAKINYEIMVATKWRQLDIIIQSESCRNHAASIWNMLHDVVNKYIVQLTISWPTVRRFGPGNTPKHTFPCVLAVQRQLDVVILSESCTTCAGCI